MGLIILLCFGVILFDAARDDISTKLHEWADRLRDYRLSKYPPSPHEEGHWVLCFKPVNSPGEGETFRVLGTYVGTRADAMEACENAVGLLCAMTGEVQAGQITAMRKQHFDKHCRQYVAPGAMN